MITAPPVHPSVSLEPRRRSRHLSAAISCALALTAPWVAGCSGGGGGSGTPNLAFSVTPSTSWNVAVKKGGASSPMTREFVLSNESAKALQWTATCPESWLTLSPGAGTLDPGASVPVAAEIDAVASSALPLGKHAAGIRFETQGPTGGPFEIPVLLTVLETDSTLQVLPSDDWSSSGPVGGPFDAAIVQYSIENPDAGEHAWTVTPSVPWVRISAATSGTLQSGERVLVEAAVVQEAAGQLEPGVHTAQVTFSEDELAEPAAVRTILLEVLPASAGVGWTSLQRSADARTIYVSSSTGNDQNDGLAESTPRRSLAAGMSLLRDGHPDWLLLRAGDTWDEAFLPWSISGRSAAEPMVIGVYGEGGRAKLRAPHGTPGLSFSRSCSHISVLDLEITPLADPAEQPGIGWLSGGEGLLVEGCLIRGFYNAIVLQSGSNHRIRRCVMVDSIRAGMYVANVAGLLLEENVLDKPGTDPGLAFFHQGFYIDAAGNTDVVVRGNIISDTTAGMSMRAGGTAVNNLFARCALALPLGGGPEPGLHPDGVHAVARDNVIVDGRDIDASNPRGWGIVLQNIASAEIEGNVVANIGSASFPFAFEVDGWQSGAKVFDITMRDNLTYGWKGEGLRVKGQSGTQLKNLSIEGNHFQNKVDGSALLFTWEASSSDEIHSAGNRFYSQSLPPSSWITLASNPVSVPQYKLEVQDSTSSEEALPYPNPGRTLAEYSALQGKAASHEAFMAEVRLQSRRNWRPQFTATAVNDWIRAGFGK